MKTYKRLIIKFIKAACFSKRNQEKAAGLLKGLETSSLLVSKNLKKKERYLKVRLDKTLKTDNYYNLDIKKA